jgi:hypothetical protein
MTRIFDQPSPGGGTRLLILGASAYPEAMVAKTRVPQLTQISSAAISALNFAFQAIQWRDRFPKLLASIDLLVNTPAAPGGATFTAPDGTSHQLDAPTMANVKAARRDWMQGVEAEDVLLFYCCGHGIWLPAASRTFLTASFGEDEDSPWSDAIALDDFAFALGEHEPRQQWLIFDCCSNTPPIALAAMRARGEPLLDSSLGQRSAMVKAHGPLTQVIVASSSPEALSFGKVGRASRFMEAFLEACTGAGCTSMTNGTWWVDLQGLERAMATYGLRVAPPEEEDYFTFARAIQTDATEVPRLLALDAKPQCTLLVRSVPPQRLATADLAIRCGGQEVGSQKAGPGALARYRIAVSPWVDYELEAKFATGSVTRSMFAVPPLADAKI